MIARLFGRTAEGDIIREERLRSASVAQLGAKRSKTMSFCESKMETILSMRVPGDNPGLSLAL